MGLEGDPDRCLQGATTSDTIHATLAAAESTRDLTEASSSAAVIAGWVGELGCVAQLERFDAGFQGGLTIEIEALEQGEVILNIARSAELVSGCVAQTDVLGGASARGTSGWSCEDCRNEPVGAGTDLMCYLVGACQLPGLGRSRSIEVCPIRCDGKRKAGEYGNDSRDLPASEDDGADSRVEHLLATTEGKLVGKALFEI